MHEKGIETFLAVAMSRTLGKAAELLNVTQSTISYNLSELEGEMGMILVDRQKGMKSIRLTPAGESFLPLALKWQEVSREIGNARSPGSAYSLNIGGTESVNNRLLPSVYCALFEHEPPVYLRILTDPSDHMYQAVESRALDVAITIHEENTRYVQIEPFYREGFAVARIPYPNETAEEYIKPSSLDKEMEFYIEWSGGYRLWHDHIWDPVKALKVRVDSLKLATSLMHRAGQWCMIPQSAIEQFAKESPSAVFHRLSDSPPDIIYYKLTHRYPKSSSIPALTIFDELLRKHVDGLGKGEKVK
ncbi:MAG: LysR family transcriptional regulator [Synergistaceae bacterium]|nr:LysR family transcriptional regulator [Synergistaceae bacterium]